MAKMTGCLKSLATLILLSDVQASITRTDIMKTLITKFIDYPAKNPGFLAGLILTTSLLVLTAGCDAEDSGVIRNEVPLPTDSQLNFLCEDEGIFPEECVLENPDNPYRTANVNDDTKFELSDDAPSAKSRYYVWATALARQPTGENQYFTALSLHQVYGESGSPTTREQTIKAYRSVLDNFFFSATFFVVPFPQGETAVAIAIKDEVGINLVTPTASSLVPLYSDPLFARDDISSWGYIWNPDNEIMSFFE